MSQMFIDICCIRSVWENSFPEKKKEETIQIFS